MSGIEISFWLITFNKCEFVSLDGLERINTTPQNNRQTWTNAKCGFNHRLWSVDEMSKSYFTSIPVLVHYNSPPDLYMMSWWFDPCSFRMMNRCRWNGYIDCSKKKGKVVSNCHKIIWNNKRIFCHDWRGGVYFIHLTRTILFLE
jgi:hypothetical protein